ncbi:mediator complex subunit med31 [Cyclospora cayetanensis]|uniref:Mediator complex subunit med31 n=1 Tax=Cyclospora cayetanensis TaxID=88456 RepID=A0A1D3CRD9_9EIME|nr:mediator complex subunit med31 [Cyclospora cayetanensis]
MAANALAKDSRSAPPPEEQRGPPIHALLEPPLAAAVTSTSSEPTASEPNVQPAGSAAAPLPRSPIPATVSVARAPAVEGAGSAPARAAATGALTPLTDFAAAARAAAARGFAESPALNRVRLEAECEFVQALANPQYLLYLQREGFFGDPRFVSYLEYLQYWQQPPYIQLIQFPIALKVLQLLQSPATRKALAGENAVLLLQQTLQLHWLTYDTDVYRDEPQGHRQQAIHEQLLQQLGALLQGVSQQPPNKTHKKLRHLGNRPLTPPVLSVPQTALLLKALLSLPLLAASPSFRTELLKEHPLLHLAVQSVAAHCDSLRAYPAKDALLLLLVMPPEQQQQRLRQHRLLVARLVQRVLLIGGELQQQHQQHLLMLPFLLLAKDPYFAQQEGLWQQLLQQQLAGAANGLLLLQPQQQQEAAISWVLQCLATAAQTAAAAAGSSDCSSSSHRLRDSSFLYDTMPFANTLAAVVAAHKTAKSAAATAAVQMVTAALLQQQQLGWRAQSSSSSAPALSLPEAAASAEALPSGGYDGESGSVASCKAVAPVTAEAAALAAADVQVSLLHKMRQMGFHRFSPEAVAACCCAAVAAGAHGTPEISMAGSGGLASLSLPQLTVVAECFALTSCSLPESLLASILMRLRASGGAAAPGTIAVLSRLAAAELAPHCGSAASAALKASLPLPEGPLGDTVQPTPAGKLANFQSISGWHSLRDDRAACLRLYEVVCLLAADAPAAAADALSLLAAASALPELQQQVPCELLDAQQEDFSPHAAQIAAAPAPPTGGFDSQSMQNEWGLSGDGVAGTAHAAMPTSSAATMRLPAATLATAAAPDPKDYLLLRQPLDGGPETLEKAANSSILSELQMLCCLSCVSFGVFPLGVALHLLALGGFSLLPTAGAEATPDWGSEAWGVGLLLVQEERDLCYTPLVLLQRRHSALSLSLSCRSSIQHQQRQQLLLQEMQRLGQALHTHQHLFQQQPFRLKPRFALRLRILRALMGWHVICINASRAAALLQPEAEPLLLQRLARAAREAPLPSPLSAVAAAHSVEAAVEGATWETARDPKALRALAAIQLQRELAVVLGG